jgi:hypothetical protein
MSLKLAQLPDMHSEQPKLEPRQICQLSAVECWEGGQFGCSKIPRRKHMHICINSYTARHFMLITDFVLYLHFSSIEYLKYLQETVLHNISNTQDGGDGRWNVCALFKMRYKAIHV